jgi:hypothetical protein
MMNPFLQQPDMFMQQVGPQGLNPEPSTVQQVDPQAASYNAALRAHELQARMNVRNMVRGQQMGNAGALGQMGAMQAGKYLGTTIGARSAAALGAQAASSLPPEAAGAATATVAPEAGGTLSSLAGTAGQAVGVAATAYGTYEANRAASNSIRDLQDAIAGGNMSPDEEAAARAKVFRAGITSQNVGGLGGLAAGWSVGGPVGGVIGAAAGASGGARQAWDSYDNNSDRLRAAWKMQTNPFKKD